MIPCRLDCYQKETGVYKMPTSFVSSLFTFVSTVGSQELEFNWIYGIKLIFKRRDVKEPNNAKNM
jgi:hypothetical protein